MTTYLNVSYSADILSRKPLRYVFYRFCSYHSFFYRSNQVPNFNHYSFPPILTSLWIQLSLTLSLDLKNQVLIYQMTNSFLSLNNSFIPQKKYYFWFV